MKKILIVGANSYIGISLEKWLMNNQNEYEVNTVGTLNDEWKSISFNGYDSIFHVAGIAHVSADPQMEDLYYKVNRDLAINVARKAKSECVKQFIFMSSMIIYGIDGCIGEKRTISRDTPYSPVDFYGRSKLEADLGIQELTNSIFKSVIIRTPLVYGYGCKGNFPRLIQFAKRTPFFIDIENERSMIYIDNLAEFIKIAIDEDLSGVFYPQNEEYISTKDVIKVAAAVLNRKIMLTKKFNGIIGVLSSRIRFINKIFGNKVYDKSLSCGLSYNIVGFEKSIKRTIGLKDGD